MIQDKAQYLEKLNHIKKLYDTGIKEQIFNHTRIEPYFYNWLEIFTPIERNVLEDIRYLGLPFYPKYPVGNYFIDFADPKKLIGVEVIGKVQQEKLHKDAKRKDLEKLGWTIYWITGQQSYKTREDFLPSNIYREEYEDGEFEERYEAFKENSSEGILTTIYLVHYTEEKDDRYFEF